MSIEFNKRIWDKVRAIKDDNIRQFIISILRHELQVKDHERPKFKDEYMTILDRLVKDDGKKQA